MFKVSDKEFEELINQSLDELPRKYISRLDNVAIVIEDEPTLDQRKKLLLQNNQTLFGLYEGIPLNKRGSSYSLVLPDKITIFKLPIEASAESLPQLKEQIKHTLWHEIAHFFGLDHERIYRLDGTAPEEGV